MGTRAQIAATTTLMSTIAQSSEPTVSSGTGAPAGGIWESLKKDIKGGLSNKGKNPNPDPDVGGNPGGSGGSGGGGNPGGDHGNGGDPGGGGNPGGNLGGGSDRLIGKEPDVFDGDRTKVEGFITKWKIYYSLN